MSLYYSILTVAHNSVNSRPQQAINHITRVFCVNRNSIKRAPHKVIIPVYGYKITIWHDENGIAGYNVK